MFITEEELAIKLYKKYPIWLNGKPRIEIEGENRSIGKVKFIFPNNVRVVFFCYLFDKNKLSITMKNVIDNYNALLQPLFNRKD